MRAWLIIGWVFLLPGLLRAAPVPPPPDDYSGAQYIDGGGCVYLRSGSSWRPRLERDGAQVCGFPPSLPPGDQDAGPVSSPQARLVDLLASDLRQGEWTADPNAIQERREPAPTAGSDRLTHDVAQSLQVSASVQATVAPGGGDRVCRLLGYAPVADGRQVLGQDVTMGLCAGMRADVPVPNILAAGSGTVIASAAPQRNDVSPVARPARAEPRSKEATRSPSARSDAAVRLPPTGDTDPEMIPASARFVRVGAFADDANATLVVRKLSAMGYPVGQRYEQHAGQRMRTILAGPFTDRQSLIAALNQIRRNGHPGAAAR